VVQWDPRAIALPSECWKQKARTLKTDGDFMVRRMEGLRSATSACCSRLHLLTIPTGGVLSTFELMHIYRSACSRSMGTRHLIAREPSVRPGV
jgi:hypothetical protein